MYKSRMHTIRLKILVVLVWAVTGTHQHQHNRTMNYWELKPYIYTDRKTGDVTGMFPEIVHLIKIKSMETCDARYNRSEYLFENYVRSDQKSVEANDIFNQLNLTQEIKQGELLELILAMMNNNGTVLNSYAPLLREPRNAVEEFFFSEGIAMVTLKHRVELSVKFWYGLDLLCTILVYNFVLVIFAAFLMFFIDCVNNGIPKGKITKNIGSNIWYIFVTMTSVGYGDIVPSIILTKFLGVLIMVFGLILASILTAIVSNFVNDSQYPIYEIKAGAIRGSMEGRIFKEQFKSTVKEYDDFNGIYSAIRNGEVEYGLLNDDIAAYQQLDWNEGVSAEKHLAVIQLVPMPVSISAQINYDPQDKYLSCLMTVWNNIQQEAIQKFRRKIEVMVLYEIPLKDIFQETTAFTFLLYFCIGIFVAGVLFDIVRFSWKYLRRNVDRKVDKSDNGDVIQTGEDIVKNSKQFEDEMTISRSEFMNLQTEMKNLNRIVQNTFEKLAEQQSRN